MDYVGLKGLVPFNSQFGPLEARVFVMRLVQVLHICPLQEEQSVCHLVCMPRGICGA